MTIAKLKTAAVALSTAVLLGMAGAGVYAFQGRDQATRPEPKPAKAGPPAPETNPGPPTDPARRRPDSLVAEGATAEPARAVDLVSTPELAAQLEVARKRLAHIKPLFERRSISTSVLDEAEGHVQILEGRVAGRAQQLEEERELLKIRLEGKRAEQEGAQAEVDVAKAGLAALRRPNEGRVMVTQEDLAKAEAGLRRAEADRAGRVAQVREIEVRIMQVERRLRALAPLLKDAKPAPAPAPALPGAPGAYKESGTNGSRIT
jgi:multidrug resistance efflux pump